MLSGFGQTCNVRASEIPVLELEKNSFLAGKVVAQEALVAEQEDIVSAIILGCAGMVEVVDTVRSQPSTAVGQQPTLLDEHSRGNLTLAINGHADQSHAN